MTSLERSLQLALVASVVLLMLVFGWTGALAARLLTDSFVFSRLEDEASALHAALEESREPRGFAGKVRLDPGYDRPASGRYWIVRRADGSRSSSRSAWEQRIDLPMLAPGQQSRSRIEGLLGEPLLVWSGGFADQGAHYTMSVAADVGPIRRRLAAGAWYFLTISVALVLALAALQRHVVRDALGRLDAIRADIERLEHGSIIALREDVPREVQPLVREFNRLLMRFEQRLRQSRNAVGNLAHALKGPLNLLTRAADDAASGRQIRAQGIAQNVERIRQLIESELKRARLAGRSGVGRRFDLAAEIDALGGLLGQVYSDRAVEIRLSIGANVDIPHDRQDMLELIGNLLDNAVKWAESLVMVSARSAEGLLLEFEDDGPGASDAELERLTGRGVRLDESVAGHGLGLSIVQDIVTTYGGELELGRSNRLGGFRARVRLPDQRASARSITG